MHKFCNCNFFSPIFIMFNFIFCYEVFISLIIDTWCSVYLWRLNIVVHCLGVERPYICGLKFELDVLPCKWLLQDMMYHLVNVILSGSMWLFLNIVTSLTFLNVILNGLKQDTSNGYRTCDVWEGRVIMSKFISFAYDIAFKVTCLPCPSIINNCLLMKNNPLKIIFLKNRETHWTWKKSSRPFFALPCRSLVWRIDVTILQFFSFKGIKSQ
jgi:hypothetical protein